MTHLQSIKESVARFIEENQMRVSLYHSEADDSLSPIAVLETKFGTEERWKFYDAQPFYYEPIFFVIEESGDLRVVVELCETGLFVYLQEWDDGKWIVKE